MSYQKDSRPSKARIKSPPLSGGEVARKTEEKGRGLSERSEFRRPRRRLRRQTQKPDNRGGASWFVFLAAKKNEQIKRINVTRTFFGRERKSFVSQSSLAVPRSIAVCGAKKYRGELRSVATRRGIKKTSNGSNRVNPPLPLCSYKEYRGSARRAKGLEYKQDPPIPPLSGGEVARKTEEKGRGLSERSEFRRPRRRP